MTAASSGVRAQAVASLVSPGGRWLGAILLGLFLLVTAVGVHFHEPDRDEAQKWLLARDTASLREMAGHLPYEGTPGLWPLLLRPLARGGAPYASMSWLNWTIMGAAAALLVFASPLPWPLKTVSLASGYLAYQYAVLARNYSLTVLTLFAAVALCCRRRERGLALGAALLLCASTSAFGIVFAAALVLGLAAEALRERRTGRPQVTAAAVGAAGVILAVWQVLPPRLGLGSTVEHNLLRRWPEADPFGVLAMTFFPFPTGTWQKWALAGAVAALYAVALAALRRRACAATFLAASVAGLLAMFSRTPVGWSHRGALVLALVGALWLALAAPRPRSGEPRGNEGRGGSLPQWTALLAAVFLLPTLTESVAAYRNDARLPYSSSRATAEFLAAKGLLSRPVVAHPAGATSALLPYLPGVRFLYPGLREFGTFVTQGTQLWRGEEAMTTERLLHGSLALYRDGRPFLILTNHPLAGDVDRYCTLEYRSALAWSTYETYWVYSCVRLR